MNDSLAGEIQAEPSGALSLAAALLLLNLVLSSLASAALVASSHHRLSLASLAFLLGLDGLVSQGGAFLVLIQPSSTLCRLVSFLTLLFLLLLLASLASLATYPSLPHPKYSHFLTPPIVVLVLMSPLLFPQVGPVGLIYERYTCGFIDLARVYGIILSVFGFLVPIAIMIFFSVRKILSSRPRNGSLGLADSPTTIKSTIIFLVSLCSILLIPHIIQINMTHFSLAQLKTEGEFFIHTGVYDTFSVWLRYEFSLFTPLLLLFGLGEAQRMWAELKDTWSRKAQYLSRVRRGEAGRRAKRGTPVLTASTDGLVLAVDGEEREAEPPDPSEASEAGTSHSTLSAPGTSSQKSFKKVPGKKIVRFAHSVKEISWKNTETMESSMNFSKERF